MRSQEFLEWMKGYNCEKARTISTWAQLRGGWEVWLQVEIASHMATSANFLGFEREIAYPGVGDKCDFKITMRGAAQGDVTYVELKCINPNTASPPCRY